MDTQSGDTAVRNGILEGVAALGSNYSVYGTSNIAVTGTHSHSGPGACEHHRLSLSPRRCAPKWQADIDTYIQN